MSTNWKKIIALILVTAVMSFSAATQAADLTSASDTISNHNPNQSAVRHTIKFKPATAIAAPGDLKIIFASGFDLSSVAPAVDVAVSGGGVAWAAPVSGDLSVAARTLTLNWTSGTLTTGNQVTVTVNFVKNPSSAGSYNITLEVGPDGFSTATDSRTIPVVIASSGVAVNASVAFPATNPTITNIIPTETIIISSGATQIISFKLTDDNNNNIDYTVTPSTGSVSVAPSPASPVSSTSGGVTVTFTYFANGGTGAQTIAVTADDNEAGGGGLVTYNIQLFII